MRYWLSILLLFATAAFAQSNNIVENGQFQQGPADNTTLKAGAKDIPGWTVINGTLAYQRNPHSGTHFVFMVTGGIAQTLQTVPGRTYRVTANIYGIHGNALVVKAGDATTEFKPADNRDNVVRTWSFKAATAATVLEIHPLSSTEISVNAVTVEPLSVADQARSELAGVYSDMDRSLYAHRTEEWLAHTAAAFSEQDSGGKTLGRDQITASLVEQVKQPHYMVRTRVVDVTGDGPSFQAKIEETVDFETEDANQQKHRRRQVTSAIDTWDQGKSGWTLGSRQVLSLRTFTDGREDPPAGPS